MKRKEGEQLSCFWKKLLLAKKGEVAAFWRMELNRVLFVARPWALAEESGGQGTGSSPPH